MMKKQRMLENKEVHDDLMSNLPEEVILLIMALLAKDDAVRLAVVSKKLYRAAQSLPLVEFDFNKSSAAYDISSEAGDGFLIREAFINFVAGSIARRRLLNTTGYLICSSLRFVGPVSLHYGTNARIHEMVNFALEGKTRVLNLDGILNVGGRLNLELDETLTNLDHELLNERTDIDDMVSSLEEVVAEELALYQLPSFLLDTSKS